jgi:hypothetical protein
VVAALHHIGEHVRVTAAALGTGHTVALAVAGGLQRVHRVHHIPGATSAATHGPWSVSIPITTSASSASAPTC